MKQEITYRWRIQWGGRWTTTRHHISVDDVKKEHPEAICLTETKLVTEIPETPEEISAALRSNSTSEFLRNIPIHPSKRKKWQKCNTKIIPHHHETPPIVADCHLWQFERIHDPVTQQTIYLQ